MKLCTGDLSPLAKVRMQIYALSIENDIDIVRPPVQFVMDKTYEVSPIGRTPELDTDDGFIPEFEVIAAHIDELYRDQAFLVGLRQSSPMLGSCLAPGISA